MKTVVISAYPCCGKTYAFEHYQDKYKILDSDSSEFSWMQVVDEKYEFKHRGEKNYHERHIKVRNPDFPSNYIKHIQENIGKVDIIFVSSHLAVRQALEDAGISFVTVYPQDNMLNEWVGRMYRRGSSAEFIKFQIEHWDEFVNNIDFEPHGNEILRLGNNEYIDVDTILKGGNIDEKGDVI